MAETLSLMEFLQALHADAELRSSFGHDPQGTLAGHGLADLSPADVHDALVLVQDTQTVDFALDSALASAPPPPPPAGDGHEAAVEYLARYLDGPQPSAAPDVAWSDVDPDAAVTPAATLDAPVDAFGAGEDLGYGDGATSSPAGWDDALDAPVQAGTDGFDLGGYDDPDASGFGPDLGSALDADFDADHDADLDPADPHAPGEDPGPALSGGA